MSVVPLSTQWQSPGNRRTLTSTSSTMPPKSSTPWGKLASLRVCGPLRSKHAVSVSTDHKTWKNTESKLGFCATLRRTSYTCCSVATDCVVGVINTSTCSFNCCVFMFSSCSSCSLSFIPGLRMNSLSPPWMLFTG